MFCCSNIWMCSSVALGEFINKQFAWRVHQQSLIVLALNIINAIKNLLNVKSVKCMCL